MKSIFIFLVPFVMASTGNSETMRIVAGIEEPTYCQKNICFFIESKKIRFLRIGYHQIDQNKKAQEILANAEIAAKELEIYFNRSLTRVYSVYLLDSRIEFNAFVDSETPDWVVGMAISENENVILDTSAWSEESKEFVNPTKLIKHEMAHSYLRAVSDLLLKNECTPSPGQTSNHWLDEGLATFASGQLQDWRGRVKVQKDLYIPFSDALKYGYPTAAAAAEFLIAKIGKSKVIEIFKGLPYNFICPGNHTLITQNLENSVGGAEALNALEQEWNISLKKSSAPR